MYAQIVGFLVQGDKEENETIGLPQVYKKSQKLINHLDQLDGIQDDTAAPLHDVYSTEFFLYCFCFMTKFPKEIIGIFEGYDYIKISFE